MRADNCDSAPSQPRHHAFVTICGEESYGTIAFPVWPSRLLIAFGLTMLALQLVAGLLETLAGRDEEATP